MGIHQLKVFLKKFIALCTIAFVLCSLASNVFGQTTTIGSCASPNQTLSAFASYTAANSNANYAKQSISFSPAAESGTIITYEMINSGSTGSLGFVLSDNSALIKNGVGSNTSCIDNTLRSIRLFPVSNSGGCVWANGILKSADSVNTSSYSNPEFYNLTPNTDYIVMVETTIPPATNDSCAVSAQYLTAYTVPAQTSTSCSTCATATCAAISASGKTAAAAHTALTTAYSSNSAPAIGPMVHHGETKTVCVPVTVLPGSVTLGLDQFYDLYSGSCGSSSQELITYSLTQNCGSAIAPTRTNVNSVQSGFNPEWDGLAAGNYVICITTNLINAAACDSVQVNQIGYYNVVPATVAVVCPKKTVFNKLNWPDAPGFPAFPTTGFNCKTAPDSIFQSLEANLKSGDVQGFPGFYMDMPSYTSKTSVEVSVNGVPFDYYGPNGTAPGGNVINWGAYPGANTEVYLPAGASITINICDATLPAMAYKIYDYTTGQLVAQGTTSSTNTCTVVSFTLGNPTMSWTLDGSTNGITNLNNGGAILTDPGALTPGKHTIVYTYSNNLTCSLKDSTTITVAGPAVSVSALVNPPCNASTGGFTMTASGSTSPYTFSTDNGTNYKSGGTATTDVVNTLGGGTYTVSTKDANGCVSATQTVTLTSPGGPVATAITPANLALNCTNTSGVVSEGATATAGYTYAWSGSSGGVVSGANTFQATVNDSGTYTVTITNAGGCATSTTVKVTLDKTQPTLNSITPPVISCSNATSTFTASSNAASPSYAWAGTGITSGTTSASVTVNAAGQYTVTVTDGTNGCSTTTAATVTGNNTKPTINAISPPVINCTNTTSTFTASSNAASPSYAWAGTGITSGTTSASVTVNAAGQYTVTVTDGTNGCSTTTAATVTGNNTKPTINAISPPVINCTNTTSTFTASSNAASPSYAWAGTGITSGTTSASVTVNAAGQYTVTVTDGTNGCSTTATATVTGNATLPTATVPANGPVINCKSANSSFIVSTNATSPTYVWAGTGITSGTSNAAVTVNAAGQYTVTVTDGTNGCSTTAAVSVSSNLAAPTVAALGSYSLTCADQAVGIAITASASTTDANAGSLSYAWSGAGTSGATNAATVTVKAANTYSLVVTDTANGCPSPTATALVTLSGTAPTLTAISPSPVNLTCTDTSFTLVELPSDSVGTLSYSWTGTAGAIKASTVTNTKYLTIDAPGTYTVQVTDAGNGCSAPIAITVTQSPNNLALDTATVPANCSDLAGSATVTVTAGTAAAYTWSAGANGATTNIASNIASGTYTVTVSDNNGCTRTAGFKVSQAPVAFKVAAQQLFSANCAYLGVDTVIITSGTVSQPVFAWPDGTVNRHDTALFPGSYVVTVTDKSNGCVQTASVTITADTLPPAVSITPAMQVVELGKSVTLLASGNALAYEWDNGDTNRTNTITPLADSTIWLYAIGSNFCLDSASAIIKIEIPCHTYFLPTAFSPNGDGENDVLYVKCDPTCVASFDLRIFDRWGEEVIEITDPTQGWDGTFRNKPLEPAVYMYYFTIAFDDGTKYSKTGNITLVR